MLPRPDWSLVFVLALLCTPAEAVPCRGDFGRQSLDGDHSSLQSTPARAGARVHGASSILGDALPPGLLNRDELPPGLFNRGALPPGLLNRGELPPGLSNRGALPPGLQPKNALRPALRDRIDLQAAELQEDVATLVATPSLAPRSIASPIPEPSGLVLFGAGLVVAGASARRRPSYAAPVRAFSPPNPAAAAVHGARAARPEATSATTLYAVIKRALDVAVSVALLFVLSPLLLLIAALIKLEDGGPVLFWQWRVGLGGKKFRCFKLRSMCVDAESQRSALCAEQQLDSPRFKMQHDPRVTHVGHWLRRFSIDEFPQLWNVILGDLSLVGPRPPLPEEVAEYEPHQRRRLDVIPGLTCIWQVSGRSLIPFEQQVELDLAYIRTRSLLVDVRLLLRTLPAVLSGRGAL